MNKNIIEIKELAYLNIFIDLNINFSKNKFITISGPNNCGKTTLIRILDGQMKLPGTIYYQSKDIEEYKLIELCTQIKTIIPGETIFSLETIQDEIKYALDNSLVPLENRNDHYKEIIKILKLNKYQSMNPKDLEENIKLRTELAIALVTKPKLLLLDNVCRILSKSEKEELLNTLKQYQEQSNMTIIMTTNHLEETIQSDYLYIISDSKIILEGVPSEVLEKDNVLNKLGLNLPFMMDLSVKLKDYEVIQKTELDIDRMVDTLWK